MTTALYTLHMLANLMFCDQMWSFSWPKAGYSGSWLNLQIQKKSNDDIMLPGYQNLVTGLRWTSSISLFYIAGARASSYWMSVFSRPIVSPKSLAALTKWLVISCKSSSEWATNAQSSGKCSLCTMMSLTFLFALNPARLRSLPCVLIWRKTPGFSPEVVSWKTAVRNSSNRVGPKTQAVRNSPNRVGAKTQPCFTPLVMENWSDSSPNIPCLCTTDK